MLQLNNFSLEDIKTKFSKCFVCDKGNSFQMEIRTIRSNDVNNIDYKFLIDKLNFDKAEINVTCNHCPVIFIFSSYNKTMNSYTELICGLNKLDLFIIPKRNGIINIHHKKNYYEFNINDFDIKIYKDLIEHCERFVKLSEFQ